MPPKTDQEPVSSEGLPPEVDGWLRETVPGEEVRAVQHVDLHGPGHFGDAWVIATEDSLVSVRWDSDGLKLGVRVPLEEVERLELSEFVGNGRLEVTANGQSKALARFTRSLARDVEVTGREIARLASEKRGRLGLAPAELVGDVGERGAARCAICGRTLGREGVCHECLDRTQLAWRMLGFVRS